MVSAHEFRIILGAFLLLWTQPAGGRQARAYSPPGELRPVVLHPDTTPPRIILTRPFGGRPGDETARGLTVVPEASGHFVVLGRVEDERAVGGLMLNGHQMPLVGRERVKKFGARLQAPRPGETLQLRLGAIDKAGNIARASFVIRVPDFAATAADLDGSGRQGRSRPDRARYWALIIGVNEYEDPDVTDLDFPVRDAESVESVLTGGYTFNPARVRTLKNPGRADVIEALDQYTSRGRTPLGQDDNLLVFYAGHGYYDADYQEGYWLPADAWHNHRANWVSNNDVQRAFFGIRARHILLISDACFSGSMFAMRDPFSVAIAEAYRERSRKAITAGNLSKVPDRSTFLDYVLKTLQNNALDFLDAGALYSAIKAPVTNNSPLRQRPLYGVIQQTGDEGGEFIFVKKRKQGI